MCVIVFERRRHVGICILYRVQWRYDRCITTSVRPLRPHRLQVTYVKRHDIYSILQHTEVKSVHSCCVYSDDLTLDMGHLSASASEGLTLPFAMKSSQ